MVLGKEELFETLKKGRPKLANVEPPQMALTLADGILTIGLDDRALGIVRWGINGKNPNRNMQDDGAAFEAWALTLKTWLGDKIRRVVLTRSGSAPMPEVDIVNYWRGNNIDSETNTRWNSGHYMRFLYRVMKFSDTYDWFSVGDDGMRESVRQFRENIYTGTLYCNVPDKEASETGNGKKLERSAEVWFWKNPGRFTCLPYKLYRQLPVCVFQEKDAAPNRIFTGGSSAIDLWGLCGEDELKIIELKTGNVMVGIITELMFYCNLMRDIHVSDGEPCFVLRESEARGFGALRQVSRNGLKKVTGCMLTDRLHPLINSQVLEEMSRSGVGYEALHYDYTAEDKTVASIDSVGKEDFSND